MLIRLAIYIDTCANAYYYTFFGEVWKRIQPKLLVILTRHKEERLARERLDRIRSRKFEIKTLYRNLQVADSSETDKEVYPSVADLYECPPIKALIDDDATPVTAALWDSVIGDVRCWLQQFMVTVLSELNAIVSQPGLHDSNQSPTAEEVRTLSL